MKAVVDSNLTIFCRQVRQRSRENSAALALLHGQALTGNIMGVLRQELDSMVRCIFLLSVTDRQYRERLLHESVNGQKWHTQNGKGFVTDKMMVDKASELHGWSQNVYRFGCGFIHLSSFHDYSHRDPLDSLTPEERRNIAGYLRDYHHVEMDETTTFRDITHILPAVFKKISGNLECTVEELEAGGVSYG
jgi:hypothetical protein